MITYIVFGIVISVSIALIVMGLIEIDAEKKREITIDTSNLPEEWIIEANRSKEEEHNYNRIKKELDSLTKEEFYKMVQKADNCKDDKI